MSCMSFNLTLRHKKAHSNNKINQRVLLAIFFFFYERNTSSPVKGLKIFKINWIFHTNGEIRKDYLMYFDKFRKIAISEWLHLGSSYCIDTFSRCLNGFTSDQPLGIPKVLLSLFHSKMQQLIFAPIWIWIFNKKLVFP